MDVVERESVTAVFLVPTMLVRLLDRATDAAPKLRSLRTVVYGGASTPPERIAAAVEAFGDVFVQIYGLTESTWPVCALGRGDHRRRPGEPAAKWHARLASCGRPTAVGELRIVDSEGREAAAGEAGEIHVRGRNTMLGYWGGAGAANDPKGLDRDGWMHTGDVGRRDAEGFVTIVDRLHDMIVTGGFNVYPREVEDTLSAHPAVLECAVVGVADAEWGECVHADVVLRAGASASAGELMEHCSRALARYKKPRTVDIVDSLPKNAAGKILRRRVKERVVGR